MIMTMNKGRQTVHSKRTCGEAKKLTSEPRNVHPSRGIGKLSFKFIVFDLKFIVI